MLNIKFLRDNFEDTKKKILSRNRKYPLLDEFKELDLKWKKNTTELQNLNTERNKKSGEISNLIKNKENTKANKIKDEVKKMKDKIETLEKENTILNEQLKNILFSLPNIPDSDVPIGKDENDNKELRKIGEVRKFDFTPLPHWELATKLNIADFERGAKLSGARHTVFKGDGAKLMRAIRNYTLDLHNRAGYFEIQPPVLINPTILYGTGHLPKAREDMFETLNGQFLSPTEEVPLTGLYANEVLESNLLPLKLTSSTLSFRSEAGSAGKDVRGLIRQHQFYNTEMVILCKEEESEQQLEEMTNECELVLKNLNLPYRVIILCTGDMGSAAVKTYDVEVWFPCNNTYREISSCSNCRSYQSLGSNIKYRESKENKLVHTLNGTGTSLNRLWIAIVENYQQKDGSIKIPDVLIPYMNGQTSITINKII